MTGPISDADPRRRMPNPQTSRRPSNRKLGRSSLRHQYVAAQRATLKRTLTPERRGYLEMSPCRPR
jgi:hypothetical protein